jgi:hypothetical protein
MYAINGSIPKKTNRRVYYNRESESKPITGYSILTYDKIARSFDDPLTTRQLRSVILSFPENQLLSYSPPSSTSLELFQEKRPQITNNIQITEIIEGTLVHLFYDYRSLQWEIATKNAVGGNYRLFNKKNKAPLEKDYPTVRSMFLDCLRIPRETEFKNIGLFDYLCRNYSYCFVMRHPKNPILLKLQIPELFLVAVYEILSTISVIIPQSVFQTWSCFKDIPIIRFPTLFSNNSSEYDDYKMQAVEMRIPGVILLDLECGEKCNIDNSIYENQRRSSQNSPELLYQYLCLRRIRQVSMFLKHFPKHSDSFFGFYECYKAFVDKIHRGYISKYIHKNCESYEHTVINCIRERLHKYYLNGGRRIPIKKHTIFEFLETSFSPDELLYFMNEDRRNYLVPS